MLKVFCSTCKKQIHEDYAQFEIAQMAYYLIDAECKKCAYIRDLDMRGIHPLLDISCLKSREAVELLDRIWVDYLDASDRRFGHGWVKYIVGTVEDMQRLQQLSEPSRLLYLREKDGRLYYSRVEC